MKIYLAGPMRGIPEFNFPAFHAAAAHIKAEGHQVFSPAENDEKTYGKDISKNVDGDEDAASKTVGFSLRDALKADTGWICSHADAIALLPGWQNSKGAFAELALSIALGHTIFEYRDTTPCLCPMTLKRAKITLSRLVSSTTSPTRSLKLPASLRSATSNTIRARRSIGTAARARMRPMP